jgi:hypothetical protein
VLGIEHLNENDLYRAMDWLLPWQDSVEKKLAKRHLADGMLVLYDITSVNFTYLMTPAMPEISDSN